MNPTPIIINPDGLTAKVKNPYSKQDIKHNTDVIDKICIANENANFKDFESANPSYPLTEPVEQGKEVQADIINMWQRKQDGVLFHVNDPVMKQGSGNGDFVLIKAWQVVSNKHKNSKRFIGERYSKSVQLIKNFIAETSKEEVLEIINSVRGYGRDQAVTEQSIETSTNKPIGLININAMYENQMKPFCEHENLQVSANGQYGKCLDCGELQVKHRGETKFHDLVKYTLPEQNMPKADESSIEHIAFVKSAEHYGKIIRENNDYVEGFIDGTNHILSSKGLVDREAVIEILRNRINILVKDNKRLANKRTAHNERVISELTDLITKLNQL